MDKYLIEVKFKNGLISSHLASEIHFYPGKGGIDIFDNSNRIPFFPGREEDIDSIIVRLLEKE